MQNPITWIIHSLDGRKRRVQSEHDLSRYTRAGRRSSLTPHQYKSLVKRRAKNKMARKSRKVNRQRQK